MMKFVYVEMSQRQVMKILEIAEKDPAGWRKTTLQERHKNTVRSRQQTGWRCGDLIGCMCAVTGKTVVARCGGIGGLIMLVYTTTFSSLRNAGMWILP